MTPGAATGTVIDRPLAPSAPGMPAPPAGPLALRRQEEEAAAERHDLLAPFDPGVDWTHGGKRITEATIRTNASIATEAMMNVGGALLYAKGQLEHGEFREWLNEQGISKDTAAKAMGLAVRFANVAALRHLPRTKAYALLGMTDEQLRDLNDKGIVETLRLDEIDTLSTRELHAKVRALTARAEKGANQLKDLRDKVADRDETIDELKAELEDRASRAEVEAAAPFNSAFARGMKALAQFEAALDCAPDADTATRCWAALNTHLGAMAQRRADQIKPGLLVAAPAPGSQQGAPR